MCSRQGLNSCIIPMASPSFLGARGMGTHALVLLLSQCSGNSVLLLPFDSSFQTLVHTFVVLLGTLRSGDSWDLSGFALGQFGEDGA